MIWWLCLIALIHYDAGAGWWILFILFTLLD